MRLRYYPTYCHIVKSWVVKDSRRKDVEENVCEKANVKLAQECATKMNEDFTEAMRRKAARERRIVC